MSYGTTDKNKGICTKPQYKNNTPSHNIPDRNRKTYADMVKCIPSTMPNYRRKHTNEGQAYVATPKYIKDTTLKQPNKPNRMNNRPFQK